jgi:TolB-like protein
MSFLADLRKRKVFQVAIGYLAVAWLLIQVTATILPAFNLPVWALRFVVLLFALGFPFAMLMAWALELTPEGVKLDVSKSGGKRMLAIAAVLVAVALGWYFRGMTLPTPPPAQPAKAPAAATQPKVDAQSIAVLPLVNASNDPDQQFFSDGLSENLIDSLSRSDGLKVVGRISAFRFRDSKDDSATIGRKLGVAYLLNGSVQRDGGIVRIGASLTRAADGTTLWAEHYDRPYENLFALQDEIAHAVADALRVKLLASDTAGKQDDRPPSGSIEAYNAYLHGLTYWYDEDFRKAAEYLDQAVQLDPGYAMAWAHLSGSLSTVAAFEHEPPAVAREHMRRARLAVDKALQLAPELGSAHAARAYLAFYEFDHKGALAGCRRAMQLAPDDSTVLNGCAYTLAGLGRLGEAISLRERLTAIEPLYNVNYLQYAELLIGTGRLDEAEKYLRIAEDLSKPNAYQHMVIAMLHGDADAALAIAMQMPAGSRGLYTTLAAQVGPDRAAADAALSRLLEDQVLVASDPYRIAQIHALRGDAGRSVEWLERAPSDRILFVLFDAFIMGIRDDPRFIAFCKQRGLPPPGESEAKSLEEIRALWSRRQGRTSSSSTSNTSDAPGGIALPAPAAP